MKFNDTISPDSAQGELEGLLLLGELNDLEFTRGCFCLRVLGCPVGNSGKPLVIEDQDGDTARDLWAVYADTLGILREKHDEWLEARDFGE